MPTFVTPKPAFKLNRGDTVVFLPRADSGNGRHRRPTGFESYVGNGEYEVCSTMLADNVVRVFVLDKDMRHHIIPIHFNAEVETLEYI